MSNVQTRGTRVAKREYHHGRTPAAWTGSAITAVGFIVAAVGFLMGLNWLVIGIGLGVAVLGAVVGGFMRKAGLGP